MFTARLQAWVRRRAQQLAAALAKAPLTPNQVTLLGMLLTFLAGALAGFGHLLWAGVVLAFAGTFDILDGALAKATNRSYPYGAFLDSTIDRYSEGAVYVGIAAYFLQAGGPYMRWQVLATMLALAGSFLVSYVRARAQSLGFKCDSGFFARPERVVVTVVGLILGWQALTLVVALLAVLTHFTALQRIHEVWRQGRAQRLARERAAVAPKTGETTAP
ncbi:MAG TPA: CDP-alcohol phosphatidyltransferase family protein [Candidatus Acidoferrales bacterium]|nr:CDP-alcohol phosphatidyltransferase family protein [Candidatus Acidoferrales bacterium]